MKRVIISALVFVAFCIAACSKTNRIAPVTGTVDGKPAITLYGSSYKPTDYILIDTVTADRKLSYDGIVFTYTYVSAYNDIFIINSSIPIARANLSTISGKVVLAIDTSFSITFGSKQYTSN